MRIFENVMLTKTVQLFPRSKKKRIRKKWMKNPSKKRVSPDLNCYVSGNNVFCHPIVARQLREADKVEIGFNDFRASLFKNGIFDI